MQEADHVLGGAEHGHVLQAHDMHSCRPRASSLLIRGRPQNPERSTESRAAEEEQDEAGTRQAERCQKVADRTKQPGGPRWAALRDTYPPATGILLEKLPELGQEDVPRSFTLWCGAGGTKKKAVSRWLWCGGLAQCYALAWALPRERELVLAL